MSFDVTHKIVGRDVISVVISEVAMENEWLHALGAVGLASVHNLPRRGKVLSSLVMLSSTSNKIAARYECDGKEVPRVLWRVRYTGQSLKARAKPAFKTKKQFKRAVELHLNWSNRIPTPFVALFGTQEHAVNWAKSHFKLGYDDVFLLKIDASKLGPIFQVRYLVQDSDIHTLLPDSMYNDEFLVLRKITRRSIIRETYLSCVDEYSSEDEQRRI